jgi:uncharacterized protein
MRRVDPMAAQEDVVRALADPAFHAPRPAQVDHVQTHISHVFLAGPYVFKLKKPVRFSFLDFGTAELRRHYCEEELRLNRRLCPQVYLDVLPVVRRADGTLGLGGAGTVVEHVLRMRRLPADRMLPVLLARDAVTPAMIDRLAELIAGFHGRAEHGPAVAAHASPEAVRGRWSDTMTSLAAAGGAASRAQLALLTDFGPRFVDAHADVFRERQAGDRVREGHGDLHAEHVCFVAPPESSDPLPGGIYVFDCIEFSPAFRCNDVAAEVAFLTMDLEHRGRRDLAERFARTYADAAGDPQLVRLLPFYASARATVRALVDTLTAQEPEVDADERAAAAERARRYLRLAVRCAWRALGPVMIACAGRSGTGKSTVAADLAELVDGAQLRSDLIRKRDAAAATRAADTRYAPAARAAVYVTLAAEADAALATARSVVADATFLRRADRDRLRAVAARHGVPCVFVVCRADPERVRERLAARRADDPSDARWDTYVAQAQEEEPLAADEPAIVLDTGDVPAAVNERALAALWAWRTRDRG